jgi:hypothetical protein
MQTVPAISPWNSLEIAKLAVGVLIPLSVAAAGLLVSRYLKRLDLAQWKNQKLLEKRIAIYDEVAPKLNKLLCFYTWIGYWKSISPDDAINAKRELDKTMNVYRHLFDDEVYEAYQEFIITLFEPYTGAGHDARIRSVMKGANGDRSKDGTYAWNHTWTERFSTPDRVAPQEDVRANYQHLMARLTHSFGVEHGELTPDTAQPTA